MGENQIFTGREIAFLKELTRRKVSFMLVGAAAAALQGAPVVTQDIDLWFEDLNDPRIIKALKKFGGVLIPPVGLNPPLLAGTGVELFDVVLTMHGLKDFAKEEKNALDIDLGPVTVKVLKLERIIKSKETVRRPKDILILPVLKDALKATKKLKRS